MAHWLAVSHSKPDTTALIRFAGSGPLNWPGDVNLSQLDSSYVKDITGLLVPVFLLYGRTEWGGYMCGKIFFLAFQSQEVKQMSTVSTTTKTKTEKAFETVSTYKEPSYTCLYRRFSGIYSTPSAYL